MLIDHCIKSRHTYLVLPPTMSHNKFNVETDFVTPLFKFLKQIRLDLSATTPPFILRKEPDPRPTLDLRLKPELQSRQAPHIRSPQLKSPPKMFQSSTPFRSVSHKSDSSPERMFSNTIVQLNPHKKKERRNSCTTKNKVNPQAPSINDSVRSRSQTDEE